MHYEIWDAHGNIMATSDTWDGIMGQYNRCRKATKEPIHLEKIIDEEEEK